MVELILAMAVFSLILLVIVAGFLNIIRYYESGLAIRDTQQNTRFGIDSIVRDARTAYNVAVTPQGAPPFRNDVICLDESGNTIVYYVNTAANSGLYKATLPPNSAGSSCAVPPSGQPVSSNNVAVVELMASANNGNSPQSLSINVLALAPLQALQSSLIDENTSTGDPECKPQAGGDRFCSVTILSSSVSLQGSQP